MRNLIKSDASLEQSKRKTSLARGTSQNADSRTTICVTNSQTIGRSSRSWCAFCTQSSNVLLAVVHVLGRISNLFDDVLFVI